MNYKFVLLMIVSAQIVACGGISSLTGDDSPKKTVVPQGPSLQGKSVGEVLKAKYNSVVLQCSLRTQRAPKLDLNAPASDMRTWDLLKDHMSPRKQSLRGQIAKHGLSANIEIEKIDLYKGNVGKFDVEYSPKVIVKFHVRDQNENTQRVWESHLNVTLHRSVFEKSVTVGFHQSWQLAGEEMVHDHVSCALLTEHKPEYQHQYRKRK